MLYTYSSGAEIYCPAEFKDNIKNIFDGNTSTGLDQSSSLNYAVFHLAFPYPLNVSTITVMNTYNATTCTYNLAAFTPYSEAGIAGSATVGKTYHINHTIVALDLTIQRMFGRYCFNDVLINYTPNPQNITEIQGLKGEKRLLE